MDFWKAEKTSDQLWCRLDQALDGMLYSHGRANNNTAKILETASFLYALVEILEEKGLIAIDELDARKAEVAKRLGTRFAKDGMGVILQDPQPDKYTFDKGAEIDCASRLHLCRASCCRIPFALSKQDLQEKVIRWDLGEPYMIEHGEDGYCVHLDRCTKGCGVYQQRPVPCRGYDCREDRRIWLDFDKRVANPAVERADWLTVVSQPETKEAPA